MANGVFYVPLDGEPNLTEDDLGYPDDPGLWEKVYRHSAAGILQCLERRERRPDCPEWMYLRVRNGVREAVHNPTIGAHSSESDAHKALKERIATAATNGGFKAEVEQRAKN